MQVLKFGGSSVATAENIKKVLSIVSHRTQAEPTIVVVSALGGITDLLLQCSQLAAAAQEHYQSMLTDIEQRHLDAVRALIPIQQQSAVLSFVKTTCNEIEDICNGIFLLKELSARTKDRIISYGELLSSRIIAAAMNSAELDATWLDSRALICTNSDFGNASVDVVASDANILECIQQTQASLYIAPGFIAANSQGIATTLGRGGSDYSAAIFAAATNAIVLEIWTDVSGMMTADPRLVPHARIVPKISYQEAMELSHFGAKVIYPPTIQPVMKKGIPIWIKNTFAPNDEGTLIQQQVSTCGNSITGISSIPNIALLSLEGSGMVGIPGFSKRLFAALAAGKINVILITQSSSEHSICVGIEDNKAAFAKQLIDETFAAEIVTGKVDPLQVEQQLAIIALVGDRMKSHTGISGKFFSALGRNGVNIRAIAQGSSERNITAVINQLDVKKATNTVHEAFFEKEIKEIHLFVAGVGNVGSKLLDQIQQQQAYLLKRMHLKVKVAGIANSKKFYLNEDGMDLSQWSSILQSEGTEGDIFDYVANIQLKNLRNTVFADVTANETVATVYDRLLQKNNAVVACNKIACSAAYNNYKKLKDLSTEYNTPFLFETNVGASLPIIGTLNDLLRSGDRIVSMEAVLSGTLNFVFNEYDGSKSFATVVKQAQEEGYTEPDPRLDLSGKDVMRKIMILARESGEIMEMDEITNNSFMPEACMLGSVTDFYTSMEAHEAHFKNIYDHAAAANCKLKFVASFKNGKASVGLQQISPQHDFYHLYGKDNIILFFTDRYTAQPLVIKGAGAGAALTASGIFADIIRTSKS